MRLDEQRRQRNLNGLAGVSLTYGRQKGLLEGEMFLLFGAACALGFAPKW